MGDAGNSRRFRPVELLAVILCIGCLACLLLPAIQSTGPHASGRPLCRNNLKHITFALQQYHDTYRTFPMGAAHAGNRDTPRIGPSWWYAILPYIDQPRIYEKATRTQIAGFDPAGVEFTYASMPDSSTDPIQADLRSFVPDCMRCLSSPLPVMETEAGFIAMPTYVGIAGGCDIDPNSTDYDSWPDRQNPGAIYVNRAKGTGPNGSIVTSSGMLPPAKHITISFCTDGTSNTMIVGEQSDFLRDVDPSVANNYSDAPKFHGDPGWNLQTDKNPGGWLSGTNVVDPVGPAETRPGSKNGSQPGDWHADILFNLTTVRYRPDLKRVLSRNANDSFPGCAEMMGHNNPLQSPHPGGVLVGLCDGSVRFISGPTDLTVLLQLAIRDDGIEIKPD